MTLFDIYHDLAARLLGKPDFPLPLPNWDRDYPHNIGLLSDAEDSALAAAVLQLTQGMSYESWIKLDMEQRVPWMQRAVDRLTPGKTGSMNKDAVLAAISGRAHCESPIVDADESAMWPDGLLDELVTEGTLRPIENAKSISCDACGHDHVETVEYVETVPGLGLRAYITCPATGRVPVSLSRLRRWAVVSKDKSTSQAASAPTADEPLSERAQNVLVAMLELGALDSDHRKSTNEIVAKALGDNADANALKAVMSDLKTRELVDSKTGRGGGSWLTEKGRKRAEKLRP